MIGTFLIAVAALIIAVLGCAWAKPVGLRETHHETAADDWTRVKLPRDRAVRPQEH
ncbi:MAG TPA: hypothetical protein VKI44_38630 [Acetobacteraceae bacterium]|nr:hypothetical protein [Acetobacteraceae bacterium]